MIKPEEVTIIIPHLGKTPAQKYALYECLKSLEQTVPQIKKIIAINSLKFEEDFTLMEGQTFPGSNLSLMVLEEQGQCKAVNAAAATVNTPYIMVSNDDMIYPEGWFDRLVGGDIEEAATNDKMLNLPFCVSPVLVEPVQGAATFLSHFCGGAGGDFDLEKFKAFVGEYYLTVKPHLKKGFNLPFLISKKLWDTVGGYDVNYDPWGSNSDSDLEYKIKLAGIQPFQQRACLVYHFSQTSGTFEPKNQGYWNENWQYFIDKWGFPRTDTGIWEATFEIPYEVRKFWPDWENKYGKR